MKPNRILALALSSALSLSGAAWGHGIPSQPVKHKAPNTKPNLEATRRQLQEAWAKIGAAENAHEFDADGHAKKAKELINQAYQELKLAQVPEPAVEPQPADKK